MVRTGNRMSLPGLHGILCPMTMRFLLFLLLLGCLPATAAENPRFALQYDVWSVPRRAETLIAMPALRGAVQALRATPAGRLILRYPGGDAGTLWVNELESWLVALGVPRERIEKTPGSADPRRIELEISRPLGFGADEGAGA